MPVYKSIFASSPDGILVVSNAGNILMANPAAEKLFGYEQSGLAGHSIDDLMPTDMAARHKGYLEKYQANPQPRPMGRMNKISGRHRSGSLFPIDVMLTQVDHYGESATLCIIRDIADRLEAERKLHLANTVFQTMQEALAVTDLDGRILMVNPAFELVTEYSEAEVLGQHLSVMHSDKHDEDFYRQKWNQIRYNGEWAGEIWNRRKGGEIYQEWLSISTIRGSDGKPVQYLVVGVDMTRMNHAETPNERLAHYDLLTGLPNRLLFHSRLQKTFEYAHREQKNFAILFLDLDGFKQVNDQLGHAAGDLLLVEIARRLLHERRETDTVARFGGDEFVIALESADGPYIQHISENLIRAVAEPVELAGFGQVRVGLSLGWASYPEDGTDLETLLHKADTALYHAKRSGRGRGVCYRDIREKESKAA